MGGWGGGRVVGAGGVKMKNEFIEISVMSITILLEPTSTLTENIKKITCEE